MRFTHASNNKYDTKTMELTVSRKTNEHEHLAVEQWSSKMYRIINVIKASRLAA